MDIKNYLIRLAAIHPLPLGLESYLRIAIKASPFKKNERLSLAIPPDLFLGFIASGTFRLYLLDSETHQQHTLGFYPSGSFLPPALELGVSEGKALYLQALEDCTILAINEQHFCHLAKIFEECTLIYQLLANRHLLRQLHYNHELKTLSAKARLALFNRDYPGFLSFVSATHVASFLGIHRNTLNFLRSENNPKRTMGY